MRIPSYTVHIWRRFNRPPAHHPLFVRQSSAERLNTNLLQAVKPQHLGFLVMGVIGAFFLVVYSTTFPGVAGIILTSGAVLITVLIVGAFSGTGPGMMWALAISGELARLRVSGMYDVIATAPAGPVNAMWATTLGVLYRSNSLERAAPSLDIPMRPALIIAGIVGVVMLFEEGRMLVGPGLVVVCGIAALYLDHTHSCIVAVLATVAVNDHPLPDAQARTFALLAFITLQFTGYGLTLLVLLGLLPVVGIPAGWGFGLPQLAVFFLSREIIIGALWHYLTFRGLLSDETPPANQPDAVARPPTPE